ncbi:MAG: efflux RND transporter periplasmic adaptor subunit [Bacteroidales bacterium]
MNKKRILILIAVLIAALGGGVLWWLDYRKYISTDDANLDSYRVDVAPLESGQLTKLYAYEGDSVREGNALFDLRVPFHTFAKDTIIRVVAPASGIIAKRWALPGDFVSVGQSVFTINKEHKMWVSVYLEETKFSQVHLGQEAKFRVDAYGDLTFYGKIFYIGDNSASEFALIPPNNASGNYTKITQRIPLKISIDRIEGDELTKQRMKLISGMSVTLKIIK